MQSKSLRLRVLAALLVFVLALAGCGTDAANQATTAPAETASAETPSEAPAETPADTSSETPAETPADTAAEAPAEPAASGPMTEVGTPRSETLIVEFQTPTDMPGQFNTYIPGNSVGTGIHQLMSAMMWEMDTVSGEQFGEVAEGMPESNADFTEHTIKIRQGIKWSDGENLDANDVAFTMNMIKDTPGITASAYYQQIFDTIEVVDDYTVKVVTKESFPRLSLRFGVTIYGNDLRIVPEHIYSQVEDPSSFPDENPVVAGPYTVNSYDPLGNWVLYERRADWEASTLGVVTGTMPPAKYIWMRFIGDDTTRQMAMMNNEVDILCEVTPEMLEVMVASNPNVAAWYKEFPYATSDDPCSKGLTFQMAKAPYNNRDFRWGVALAMNFDEISMSIFDGAGRASPIPILTATSAMQELYFKPTLEWLEAYELDLGDGTTVKPFDNGYAARISESLRASGYDIPTDEAALIDMFGYGCWKYDPVAAEKLFIKAGLEKRADGWYFEGQPFTINLTYLADTEIQQGRGATAAYDQLIKFGFNCTIASVSSATWSTNDRTGDFEIASYWPTGFITKDIYSQISGFDSDLIVPLGETGSGQGSRWNNTRATEIIKEMATLSPEDPKSYELGLEFLRVAIEDLPFIGFHSGVKFVPYNATYWTNFPSADNPYNGPWWWWSCFKYIAAEVQPVQQ